MGMSKMDKGPVKAKGGRNLESFLKITATALLIVLLAAPAASGGLWGGKKRYGDPTPIPDGATPLDVLCRIQEEFIRLPKPILKKIVYHKRWKVTRFAAGSYWYGPFYEVRLTKDAYRFYQSHSPREILVAMTPLLFDPDMGGEAAVLLAGPPVKDLETASRVHAGDVLIRNGYRSPTERGVWDIEKALLFVGYPGIGFDVYERPVRGTLDYAIYEVLKAEYPVRYPDRLFYQPFDIPSKSGHFKMVEDMVSHIGAVRPTKEFSDFLSSHPGMFTAGVLFASRYTRTALMWTLGLEKDFWPVSVFRESKDLTPYSRLKAGIDRMEEDFLKAAGKELEWFFKKCRETEECRDDPPPGPM